jgi:hypothetical protein
MSRGSCSKHGPQKSWDGVCLAIGDALKQDQPVGFVWGEDKGFHWAVCTHCDAEIAKGHERPHKWVPACHECFLEAWQLNGRPERHNPEGIQ